MTTRAAWSKVPYWLALGFLLGPTQPGCDALGLGTKKETKATKADDDEGDEGDKKTKKKKKKRSDDQGTEASSSATASASATSEPTAAPSAASADSTGIPECDEYVAKLAKCIPDSKEGARKLADGLKQGAIHARDQMIKTCKEGIEGLSQVCPGK